MGNKTCCPPQQKQTSFKMCSTQVQVKITPEELEKQLEEQETGFMYGKSEEDKFQRKLKDVLSDYRSITEKQSDILSRKSQQGSNSHNIFQQNSLNQPAEILLITNERQNKKLNCSSNQRKEEERKPLSSKILNSQSNIKVNDAKKLKIPELSQKVQETFEKTNFFILEDLKKQPLNWQKVPDGFFKYVKDDGSLYIGNFQNGKAHGRGVYIFADGSYYEGMFRNDKAHFYGSYYSKDLVYKGEFKNNLFDGKGVQQGKDYVFSGTFHKGAKYYGSLEWKQADFQYRYSGSFNSESKFQGQGKLTEPTGIYEGSFKNGLKNGEGTYKFKNQCTFQGRYKDNKRHGQGRIIDSYKRILFKGTFQDNLPVFSKKEKGQKQKQLLLKFLGEDKY